MTAETCPLLDELPWIKHGFFGLDNEHAVTNDLVGFREFDQFTKTFFLPQTHSDKIAQPNCSMPDCADASMTAEDNVALAVKTADCAPILLVCRETKMIAAVHAGWPGTLNQIACKTVKAMKDKGAKPEKMIAAIGPCLQVDSFAIQADVHDKFQGQLPEYMDYLTPFEDRWKLDMVGILQCQLKKTHVDKIWISKTNTLTNKNFASYRRRGTDPQSAKTRNVSMIAKITP